MRVKTTVSYTLDFDRKDPYDACVVNVLGAVNHKDRKKIVSLLFHSFLKKSGIDPLSLDVAEQTLIALGINEREVTEDEDERL